MQLKSPKKSTDIAFLYLRPWPKNRHAARATFPHRKFLPDFCRTFDGLFIRFAPFCSFRQQKAKMPQNRDSEAKKAKKMVHPTRFELMTFYSGGRRSIQLSYGCPCHCYIKYSLFLIFKAGVDKNPVFFNDFPGNHGNSGIFPPPHLPKLVIFSVPFPKCPCEI